MLTIVFNSIISYKQQLLKSSYLVHILHIHMTAAAASHNCILLTYMSGGAKVLGKLPVPGRPTNLDYSRARAYCACNRSGCGLFRHFFSHLSLLFSFSLSLGDGPI